MSSSAPTVNLTTQGVIMSKTDDTTSKTETGSVDQATAAFEAATAIADIAQRCDTARRQIELAAQALSWQKGTTRQEFIDAIEEAHRVMARAFGELEAMEAREEEG